MAKEYVGIRDGENGPYYERMSDEDPTWPIYTNNLNKARAFADLPQAQQVGFILEYSYNANPVYVTLVR